MARKKKDQREKDLENMIGAAIFQAGSLPQLARLTGINYATLNRRCKNVRTLTAWEIWAIQDVMEGVKT